ncbi:unnamed protein product [Arctia plantaginis]|uniref:Uncharacterized protein n=1 Tax=Arctia plantaginis TaxID=874455 RepID=A0A8S1A0C7_ARCPL|nr:unnamed protein product [Arctia plantaginis]
MLLGVRIRMLKCHRACYTCRRIDGRWRLRFGKRKVEHTQPYELTNVDEMTWMRRQTDDADLESRYTALNCVRLIVKSDVRDESSSSTEMNTIR